MPLSFLRLGLAAFRGRHHLASLAAIALGAVALPAAAFASLGAPAVTIPAGAGPYPPMSDWTVTQGFGCTGFALEPALGMCPHFHSGMDLAAPEGSPVRAVLPGLARVIPARGLGGGYGLHVVVHHPGSVDTLYGHLAAAAVGDNQPVLTGEVLGYEGSSGLSTGPHLHFEVRESGSAVDPRAAFPDIFAPSRQARAHPLAQRIPPGPASIGTATRRKQG